MNDAQPGTSTTELGANSEALNVVLGRFQSWAAAPAKLSDKAGTKKVGPPPGALVSTEAREISYDQAVRASRYRRHEEAFPPDPVPDPPLIAAKDGPRIGSLAAKEDLPAAIRKSNRSNGDEDVRQKSRVDQAPGDRWPEASFIKAATAVANFPTVAHDPLAVSEPIVVSEPIAEPTPKPKFVDIATPAPVDASPLLGKEDGVGKNNSPDGPSERGQRDSPAAVDEILAAATAGSSSPGSRAHSDFSEVMSRASAKTAPASPKSVCLTLHAADGERARLQESAAKASLSAAVYLRQCSLGMDDLRVQIEIALSRARLQQQRQDGRRFDGAPFRVLQFGARCWKKLRRSNSRLPGFPTR